MFGGQRPSSLFNEQCNICKVCTSVSSLLFHYLNSHLEPANYLAHEDVLVTLKRQMDFETKKWNYYTHFDDNWEFGLLRNWEGRVMGLLH